MTSRPNKQRPAADGVLGPPGRQPSEPLPALEERAPGNRPCRQRPCEFNELRAPTCALRIVTQRVLTPQFRHRHGRGSQTYKTRNTPTLIATAGSRLSLAGISANPAEIKALSMGGERHCRGIDVRMITYRASHDLTIIWLSLPEDFPAPRPTSSGRLNWEGV